VADDEIVCPACGMSLALARRARPQPALTDTLGFAAADDAPSAYRDVPARRLVALLFLGCLVVAATALLVLDAGKPARHETALPLPSAPRSSSAASVPVEDRSQTATPLSTGTRATPARPTATRTPTRAASSARPHPVPSRSGSPAPATSAVAETRSVRVSRGAVDTACGPHCYRVAVSLSGFSAGTHQVACWAGHAGEFGGYRTSAGTSASCAYRHPHDVVWVIVDGRYRSNSVLW
jgi:hypothetical protein